MRKLVRLAMYLVLGAVCGAPAFAQQGAPFPIQQYLASNYGRWQIHSQQANTYLFSPPGLCQYTPPASGQVLAFSTNAPIFIQDATASNSELLTPSAVVNNGSQCGVTIAAANQHYSFNLISGTGGLQEALNQIGTGATFPVEIILDRSWYTQVSALTNGTSALTSPGGIIYNAAGKASAYLIDQTTAPYTFYSWNGTHYTPSATNLTAPTVAAGAGAGTGPTIAIVAGSTGLAGNVTLTTGTTPTASAAIFTLTWPAIASGGFQYAPACTFSSSGTRLYTTGTASSTAGPPATATLTASSTALTASVSGYQFSYSCH